MKDKIIKIFREYESQFGDDGSMDVRFAVDSGEYSVVADEIMSLFEYMLSEDYEEDYKGGGV